MSKIDLEQVISIVSKNIKVPVKDINMNSKSSDFYQWDSLAHLKIMLAFEKMNNKKINTTKISELNSIKKIFDYLG